MNRLRSSPGALLVDMGDVPAAHCDDCLEGLFKALAESPQADADRTIWAPHHDPALAPALAFATAAMERVLGLLQDAFARALTGEPIGVLAKATPWLRWSEEQFRVARAHLESKPPASYSLEEWMTLVDLLLQEYLPDGVVEELADYATVRQSLMGKIKARLEASPLAAAVDWSSLSELVPTRFAHVPPRVLSPLELAILRVSKARTAMHIGGIAEDTRRRMKGIILEHVQAMLLGQREGTAEHLRTRLFDHFGALNKDMRRIAVTETAEASNTGYIASLQPGTRVRRVEMYHGACDWCRHINGRIFVVVEPFAPVKDGEREVWVGKTNVGRSASPRKRVAGELVDREPDELWWCAAGAQHPHCRGGWVTESTPKDAAVDDDFDAWLDEVVAKHSPAARRNRRLDAERAAAEAGELD